MQEVYVTLEEAAALESQTYESLKKCIQRNPDKYITKSEPAASGGKERIMILLDSLSPKAIRAYQAKAELEKDITDAKDIENKKPWYVDTDINWYITNNREQYEEAVGLKQIVEEYLTISGNRTEQMERIAAELGMSARNFKRKVDSYLEGAAWSLKKAEEDGKNYEYFKVLALSRKPREDKGEYISITEEMKTLIQNIWFDPLFAANLSSQMMLYEQFCGKAKEKGWVAIPSYQTVNRYLNELDDKYANEKYLAAFGTREFRRARMLKRERNTGMLRVMELVQGDGHKFDCWVRLKRQNGTETAIRPHLVGIIDTRSRCLVGWAICEVPSNREIKQCLLHMIYPKKNNPIEGVPRVLLIDNGKDWTAETLTGRPRTERFDLDAEIKGFYKGVGIESDMRSLPYQAWTKAEIERFFGSLCRKFTRSFTSYTGTLTGSKTIGKINKDIPKMLQKGQLIDIEDFAKEFDQWLNEVYHRKPHSGLKKQGEMSPIPIDVYQIAERYPKAAPPIEYARMLLMCSEERNVTPVGFVLQNRNYQHELLANYIGKKITIRYNPDDTDTVHAYDSNTGKKICDVVAFEGLNPLADKDDVELINHIMQQNRQIRKTKEQLKELRTPYAEREKRKVILPELSGEAAKVTSIPDDKQYRDEIKERKAKPLKNEYLNKQGQKALALLQNIAEG